jgi:hypothetical protein
MASWVVLLGEVTRRQWEQNIMAKGVVFKKCSLEDLQEILFCFLAHSMYPTYFDS